jgi:succinate dehydrogenase/fumarate reductase-like Fe-S protein
MRLTLKIWRQKDRTSKGRLVTYELNNATPDMSFLEMLDLLNLDLARKGEETVAFDHDCREGICGTCSLHINGRAHGPLKGVAACKNASAMLFVAAKVSQLALLPQGQAERKRRVEAMVAQMDREGFGACSNTYACEAECPKQVSVSHIARLNRELLRAKVL